MREKKTGNTADILRVILRAGLLVWIVIAVMAVLQTAGLAEEDYEERYVLCMDRVNIRQGPGRNSNEIGWLECGDRVWVDGKKKNGYVHCVGLNIEEGEGWIHKGYLVEDEPVKIGRQATITSRGRLAARKYVDGKRTRWLRAGAKLKVYWWTSEWSLTDCGYVKSMYLDVENTQSGE